MRRDVHGLVQGFLLAVGVMMAVALIAFAWMENESAASTPSTLTLDDWSVRSDDGHLSIDWEALADTHGVHIQVMDGETAVYESTISRAEGHVSFDNGEHGRLYTVRLTPVAADGSEGETAEKQALFLDYDSLPNIPLVTINTATGDDPTFSIREKTDDRFLGQTIADNDYLSGEMTIKQNGEPLFASELELSVRGNTSAIAGMAIGKVGYRLRLESPYQLSGHDGEASTDWTLLNSGENIKTYVGDWMAEQCDMEWRPYMAFVNVMLNGDWKGTYCLTPTVCIQNAQGLVSKTGYIFEDDAYWWAADGIYFRTRSQGYLMAYTFKYPPMEDADDEHLLRLQEYMQELEDYLIADNPAYRDYIDEESFAKWILARDVLGNIDGAGANINYYKYDFDTARPTSSRVKMGPPLGPRQQLPYLE